MTPDRLQFLLDVMLAENVPATSSRMMRFDLVIDSLGHGPTPNGFLVENRDYGRRSVSFDAVLRVLRHNSVSNTDINGISAESATLNCSNVEILFHEENYQHLFV